MSDIGPGDVVEATRDSVVEGLVSARRGERDVVIAIDSLARGQCHYCRRTDLPGLILQKHQPANDWWIFCACGWRKIGGTQADTMRLFAEDLNVRTPENGGRMTPTPTNGALSLR